MQDNTDNIDKEIQEDKEDAEEQLHNQANWFASIRSKLEASNQQLASKIERSNKRLEERFQTSNRFIGSKFQEGLGTIQEGFGSIAAAPGLAANTIRQQHNTRVELKEKLDSEHWKHTRKLLTKFECLDYTTIYNKSFRTELYLKFFNVVGDYEWLRWILSFFIGAFIGFLAWSSKTIIKAITTKKFELIQEQMNKDTAAYYFLAYCMYTFFNIAVAVLGSIIAVYFEPTAAGSGIPEVKAYLNGTKVPRFLRLRTLIAKYTSMVLANLAGLPLGAEGPMIHMGALTGNAISQAQSKELGFKIKWINHFRNDRDKRDFITSGAGAGVAAAFGAPLGGTLFSLEEVSSFWSTTLTWRTFFTCMIAVLTNEFLLTAQGSSGLIIFDLGAHELSYHIIQTFPIAVIGVIGGLLGAGFTVFNMAVNRMRGKKININPKFRVLELVAITLVLSTIQYGLPFIFGCKDVPNACLEELGLESSTNTTESFDCEILRQHHCPEGQYSDLASIVFNTNEHIIINLLKVNMPHLLSFLSIAIFFVLYTVGAAYTAGCGIASGLFVPMVVIGAAYGRFVGLGLVNVIGGSFGDPGFFAIMGTAAFMAGLSRLSVSLCVIIIEITNDLQNLLPIMLVIFIAKLVADYITHPLFDSQIEAKHIPFLEPDPAKEMKILMCKHIMAKKVKFLCEKDTVENILNLLTNTTHNGFPVVNNEIERQVKGIILRPQLLVLLERKSKLWMSQSDIVYSHQEYQTKLAWNLPELAAIVDAFGDEDYQHIIDLSPYMNITVYSVNEEFAVSEAFKMFRTMGLRHLVVVNDHNKVKGMITKKDLMEHSCKEKYKQLKTLKKKNLDLDLEETMIDTVPGTPAEPQDEQEQELELELGIELEEQEEEGKGKGKGKRKKMKKNTSSASLLTHDFLSDNNNNNNEL